MSVFDKVCAFDGACGAETPARAAHGLVLDRGDGAVKPPVHAVGNFDLAGVLVGEGLAAVVAAGELLSSQCLQLQLTFVGQVVHGQLEAHSSSVL